MKHLLSILVLLSIIGMNPKAEAYKECTFIFCTDIFEAIEDADYRFVARYIGSGADLNIQDNDGRTPLHRSIESYRKIAQLLIKKEGSIWSSDARVGQLKFNLDSISGIAEFLVNAGADLNAQDDKGNAPLHLAARYGLLAIADLLTRSGADLNIQNNEGKTPLKLAIENNLPNMTEFLRSRGAIEAVE